MKLHTQIFKNNLSSRAKLVYANIVLRADKDGVCFPSHKTLASETGLSVSTVKRAIADLISDGYIEKEKRVRSNQSDTSNFYKLLC